MVITRVFKNGGGRKAEVSEEVVAMEERCSVADFDDEG